MTDTVFLVFPDQLFKSLFTLPKAMPRYFIEDERFFRQFSFHKHRLIFHRASMQATRERLLVKGFTVEYYDSISKLTLATVFSDLKKRGVREVQYYTIATKEVASEVWRLAQENQMVCTELPTPAFLSTGFSIQKSHQSFDHFYEIIRTHYKIFINKEVPLGGSWQLVAPLGTLPLTTPLPTVHIPEHNRYVEEAIQYVDNFFKKNKGSVDNFVFPVTYADAEDWLEDFILHRLAHHSLYREVVLAQESIIYHAGLAPFLNCGLLTPQQVLEAVIVYQRRFPLQPEVLEYFIRELVGYREYAWVSYNQGWSEIAQNTSNIPAAFLSATTGLTPIDTILQRTYAIGFCHTRERKVLETAFMLLGGSKRGWYEWQRTMLVDTYDWSLSRLKKDTPEIITADDLLAMSDFSAGNWVKKWEKLQK